MDVFTEATDAALIIGLGAIETRDAPAPEAVINEKASRNKTVTAMRPLDFNFIGFIVTPQNLKNFLLIARLQ